jgi:hypothetical protein
MEEENRGVFWTPPEVSQRSQVTKDMPNAHAAMTDQVIEYFKRQAEADPYMLLQPLPVVGPARSTRYTRA